MTIERHKALDGRRAPGVNEPTLSSQGPVTVLWIAEYLCCRVYSIQI